MNPGNDPARDVARLRALIEQQQKSIRAAAATLGRSKSSTHEMAVRHRLQMRRRALPAAKRQAVQKHIAAARLTLSEIARLVDVSKSTVSRQREKYLAKQVGAPKVTRTLKTPKRCANGHLVTEWPCMTCACTKPA